MNWRAVGLDSIKQCELEFLTGPKGVVKLIDLISSNDNPDALSTLRVYDIDKVR